MRRLRIVLDTKAALLLGGAVGTEGAAVIHPVTRSVVGMITGIKLRTAADTADTRYRLFEGLEKVFLLIEIAVKGEVHQLRPHGGTVVHHEHPFSRTFHIARLYVGAVTAWQAEDAGVGIGHGHEMIVETLVGLLVLQQFGKLLRGERTAHIGILDIMDARDAIPDILVITAMRVTEIVHLVAALAQFFD